MTSIPLHPALVHLPLGLALVLPLLAIGFSWAVWKGSIPPRAWPAIVVLKAVLLGAGLVALRTGQHEEGRVESVVPKTALERHEARAEQFLWIAGLTLATATMVPVVRRPRSSPRSHRGNHGLQFFTAAAALRVGHAGGQLVYVHNAAAAYLSDSKSRPPADNAATKAPVTEAGAPSKDD